LVVGELARDPPRASRRQRGGSRKARDDSVDFRVRRLASETEADSAHTDLLRHPHGSEYRGELDAASVASRTSQGGYAVAEAVLADPVLRDQGLLSRTLMAWPALERAEVVLEDYDRRMTDLLEKPRPCRDSNPRELAPRLLRLTPQARQLLIDFANEVESAQRPGQVLEPVRGFASKAAEQAARIAAVLTAYADPDAEAVEVPAVANAVSLTTWYLREAKRLLDCGKVPEDLADAEALRAWLVEHWREDFIDIRTVARGGPYNILDAVIANHPLGLIKMSAADP